MSNHFTNTNAVNSPSPSGKGCDGAYILSTSAVSPQASYEQMLCAPASYSGEKLHCTEPDYTKYVDPKLIRRMSRIIKMGVAAAMETLQQAQVNLPDAIITGTAYGCLADTDAFLTRLVEFNEELLSPTAFIQSTHNTVGAQIALMLGCRNYNNTYVHRGSSFESAVMDALSLMGDGSGKNILVGGVDEITEISHAILRRFDLYKPAGDSLGLVSSATKGSMAGEGAAFFMMSAEKANAIAKLQAVQTWYKSQLSPVSLLESFLEEQGLTKNDVDVLLSGSNGDAATDEHYKTLEEAFPRSTPIVHYKTYCGEYPTSSAFALWMALQVMQSGKTPSGPLNGKPQKLVIYNNYKLHYPTFYLLSAC